MEKKKIRQIGMAGLNWLYEQEEIKKNKEAQLNKLLFSDRIWTQASTVGIVKSLPFEFNTQPLIEQGWLEGKKMAVPKTEKSGLVFHGISPEASFRRSPFGVEEPVEENELLLKTIDLLIVPGIAFTLEGLRVGFGGGYYDRILSEFQGSSCSLVFSEQIQESWRSETFDRKVEKLFIQ